MRERNLDASLQAPLSQHIVDRLTAYSLARDLVAFIESREERGIFGLPPCHKPVLKSFYSTGEQEDRSFLIALADNFDGLLFKINSRDSLSVCNPLGLRSARA